MYIIFDDIQGLTSYINLFGAGISIVLLVVVLLLLSKKLIRSFSFSRNHRKRYAGFELNDGHNIFIVDEDTFSTIITFEVIKPLKEEENIGDLISLDDFGYYQHSDCSTEYSFVFLLQNPENYRPITMFERGRATTLIFKNQ